MLACLRVETGDAGNERAPVGKIDVVALGVDRGPRDVVTLGLKRTRRMDDDPGSELAESCREIAAVRIDTDRLLLRQAECSGRASSFLRIAAADEHADLYVLGQGLRDARTEEPVAAQYQDAQH